MLLVGDPYQLPPIGFGLIYQRLCGSAIVPQIHLSKVHRQQERTGIPAVALQVRNGVVPTLSKFRDVGTGVSFVEAGRNDIFARLVDIAASFATAGEHQVLCINKRGQVSVEGINDAFHYIMSPGRRVVSGWSLAEGEPIIFLRNDYERSLWNGSLGRSIRREERSRCMADRLHVREQQARADRGRS